MIYFVCGLAAPVENFLFFVLILNVCVFVGTSFGFFVGCVFDNYGSAAAVTGIVVNIPMMFSGVFANITAFPGYL